MSPITWLMSAFAVLALAALAILLEYGIDAIFDNGEIDDLDHY
jgi:hypothetical protein